MPKYQETLEPAKIASSTEIPVLFLCVFSKRRTEMEIDRFVLFPRTQKGNVKWYYYIYDENGNRKYRSTGTANKAKARAYVLKKYKDGTLFEFKAKDIHQKVGDNHQLKFRDSRTWFSTGTTIRRNHNLVYIPNYLNC